MPIARSSVIGAVSGAVLLAGFVGFAVGLPELTGDGESVDASVGDRPPVSAELPESLLDDRLVRVSTFNEEVGEEVEEYGSETLTSAFDAETAVGRYISSDGQVELSITVSDAGAGLFLQSGPPTPSRLSVSQGFVQRVRQVDGVVCAELFSAPPQTQGQPQTDPTDGAPVQVQCQTEVDGRAFNAYTVGGLPAELAVEALQEAIALDTSDA